MRLLLLTGLLVLSNLLFAPAQEKQDFAFERNIEMEIDRSGDKYFLKEKTEDTYTYLSERACQTNTFYAFGHYFGRITDISGEFDRRQLPASAVTFENDDEDSFVSSSVTYTIRFPKSISPGQKAGFQYKKEYLGLDYLPILYLPNIDYTKKWHLTINHPDDVRIDFEVVSAKEARPFTIKRDEDDRTELIFENIPYSAEVPYFAFNRNHSFVQVKVTKDGKSLNPTTVPEFAQWYRGLFDQNPLLKPQHARMLDEEISKATSTTAKVKTLHDFVRKNIRYIAQSDSMGAIVPRPPGLVLDRKYGDCKDRAYLISTLARNYGIDIDMATVSTDPMPEFKGTGINQYNHVICSFEDNGKRIFFDPTDRYSPYGNLPETDIEARALVLNPAKPQHYTIPAPNLQPSLDIVITGSISEPKQAKAKITFRNSYYSRAQYAQQELTGIDRENYLLKQMNSPLQKISIQHPVFESETDTSVTYSGDADLSAFIISSETKKYILQNAFTVADAAVLERENDTFALYLPSRLNTTMTLDLATDGYSCENTVSDIGDGKPMKFAAIMTQGERTKFTYSLSQQEKFLKGEKKMSYLVFCKDYFKNKKNMFVLSKREK